MSVEFLYDIFSKCSEVTIDSRNCPKDALFFAIKGDRFDGNQFAVDALQNGCRYAVIDNPAFALDHRFILVQDTLSSLQQLANYHRSVLNIPVIAITGTNGKTTTKELLAAVLSKSFNTLYTQGNLNNHIGVPLTLLKLTINHQIAIIEMGANHPGEIQALAEIAAPDYGIITNIGKAHLEGFGSFEGVIHAKGELYDYIRKHNGSLFLHVDNPILKQIAGDAHIIGYSTQGSSAALIQVESTGDIPFLSVTWRKSDAEVIHHINTHLVGNYNLENVAAAVCVGTFLGIQASTIDAAIEAYVPSNMRSQWQDTTHNHLIIDTYNANPSSMKAAIENLVSMDNFPKGVILADMLELGQFAVDEHASIVETLKNSHLDQVLLVGPQFAQTKPPFTTFASTDDLNAYLQQHPLKGFTLLVKGSHGMHLEKCLPFL
ncbi:MAG: UDP-N-acetylmuramoyl-tripeptide--D-alanyl-D-alanine ligase [Microbacter sp.]